MKQGKFRMVKIDASLTHEQYESLHEALTWRIGDCHVKIMDLMMAGDNDNEIPCYRNEIETLKDVAKKLDILN